MKKEAKIRFFSVTVDMQTKLKIESLAKKKDRSESWITEKAIELLDEELL